MDGGGIKRMDPYIYLPLTFGSEMLIEVVNLKLRIKTTLVGMEGGRYIITKLSANDLMGSFRSDTVKKSPIIVRYLHKGTVHGYKAKILNVVSNPAKLFFLSYPEKIDELNVLTYSRYECVLPARTMLGNDLVDMVIVDISHEGCLAVIKTRQRSLHEMLQVNKKIDIVVQFPNTHGNTELKGKIRNIGKDVDKVKLGVVFEGLSPELKAVLASYINLITGKAAL